MKSRDVFPKITPPPGGLGRLRRRMREEAAPRAWWAQLKPVGAVALVLATAIVLVVVTRRDVDPFAAARRLGGPSEVALGLARAPREAVTLAGESRETAALVQVPTGDPRVAIYMVGTLE
jgi:negative regulator of sigma E activity